MVSADTLTDRGDAAREACELHVDGENKRVYDDMDGGW